MGNTIKLYETESSSWMNRRGYPWAICFHYSEAMLLEISEVLTMLDIDDSDYLYHVECGTVYIGIRDETTINWLKLRYA